jgi:5-methylcytosine-specific restriction protein B
VLTDITKYPDYVKELSQLMEIYPAPKQTAIKSPQPNPPEVLHNMPINKIFYGPPGTGKTYKLQNLIKNNYTENAVIQNKDVWLAEQIDSLNWFEILVLVLLDADAPIKVPNIISHDYYQKKAALNNRSSNLKQTAWSALQTHALVDSTTVKYSKRVEPLVFDKTDTSLWFISDIKDEQLEEYVSLLESLKKGPQQARTIKRFEFVTFHQSYGYEEFIEGLRPVTNDTGDITYEVKPGVFKRICKRAESDPGNQYALVIDEINRGNISKIFGELISLVEIDKRKGSKNQLTVTLPYSDLPFTVPSNLDIIGTMNTADRSLTHIDVALRRRFAFEELRTDYSLLSDNISGINVKRMLYAMNQRIELLLDREHILGHAYLMHATSIEDLEHSFKTNIMPLLEEYFFEDWEKISQVFNFNTFITEQKEAQSIWLGAKDEYSPKSFRINSVAFKSIKAYLDIYSSIENSAFAECDQ